MAGVSGPAKGKAEAPPQSKTPEDFLFISQLGEGSYSTVYFAKEVNSQREYAIKVCYKQHIMKEKKVENIKREKEVLIRLNHPFFLQMYCTFQDRDKLYFVTSLAKNGELLDYMRKMCSFDAEVTRFYSAEIIVALKYLHETVRVIHRDLKPENILLSENMHIMISDFGSAKLMDEPESSVPQISARSTLSNPVMSSPVPAPVKKRSSFVGTAQYLSPEILNGEPASPSCDYWALGCIIYQMLAGLPPFRAPNEYLIFQKINKLEYSFPCGFPDVPKTVVEGLLRRSGAERLGVEDLMEHSFFAGVKWDTLPEQKPPAILPYLPASGDQPDFHSNYHVPENIQPGLDDMQLTRLLGLELNDTRQEKIPTKSEWGNILNLSPEERERKLREQKAMHPFHRFVESNLILKDGLVDKRKGLFARRRMFLLTEGPHLYYVDPSSNVLKGQVPWSKEMRPEAKNFKTFFVHTPNRTYYLEDPNGHALSWCDAIEQVREYYFCGDGQSKK